MWFSYHKILAQKEQKGPGDGKIKVGGNSERTDSAARKKRIAPWDGPGFEEYEKKRKGKERWGRRGKGMKAHAG